VISCASCTFFMEKLHGYMDKVESRMSGYSLSHTLDSSVPSLKDEIALAPIKSKASEQIDTPVSPAAI
jgi:hypothetical protein